MRKLFMFFVILLLFTSPSVANEVAQKYITNVEQVGTGRLSVFLWDVYDATLYAPRGKWDPNMSYALSIHYFHAIEGADIAKRSVEEIQKQGFSDTTKLTSWYEQMRGIFPDVKSGSELTAVFTDQKSTVFYSDGKLIGSIKDIEFGALFSDIWLSEKTSEPELRRKLLGLS